MNPLRRMFLRHAVGAAAFAPMAGNVVAETMRNQALASTLSPPMGGAAGIATGSLPMLSPRIQRLRSALNIAESEARESLAFRVGPFDPDIAAIGSVSNSFRAGMQRRRDDRRRSTLDRLRRLAWGN